MTRHAQSAGFDEPPSPARAIVAFAVLCSCVAVGACAGTGAGPATDREDQGAPQESTVASAAFDSVLAARQYSGLGTRERLVVRTPDAWAALWSKLTEREQPRPALPAVDFEAHAVVVASMGERTSGGYTISIDSARVIGSQLRVYVRETSPLGCATTGALTQPTRARLVTAQATRLDVVWVEKAETRRCG